MNTAFSSAAVLLLALTLQAAPETSLVTTGQIVSIPDGDTVCIQVAGGNYKKVRLAGIDAPENDQPEGEWAGNLLRQLAAGAEVKIVSGKEDKYGRLLGTAELKSTLTDECTTVNAKVQINEYMLCKGAAWYYKQFERDYAIENKNTWLAAFAKAKAAQKGLWNSEANTPPWNWRQKHEPVPVPCP